MWGRYECRVGPDEGCYCMKVSFIHIPGLSKKFLNFLQPVYTDGLHRNSPFLCQGGSVQSSGGGHSNPAIDSSEQRAEWNSRQKGPGCIMNNPPEIPGILTCLQAHGISD